MAARGREGIELLTQAVKLGETVPPRLEQMRALIELGAALRRANRRADAREPLRRGLDLSHRSGAGVLAARARTELLATGARPRRLAQTGVESLTVSQRRVAELAARGLTTRQVAEALFVTPKTVEFHLRQTYLKLGLSSRAELTAALSV
jgi:DNA-binding CsgD family transcriptional regulator